MLRANVGLSRKVCREFQSTGYSVNLDAEIPFSPDDAEGVLEKVRELFDLAHEAVDREIDRDLARTEVGNQPDRINTGPLPHDARPVNGADKAHTSFTPAQENGHTGNGSQSTSTNGQKATEKQVQFILTMGRRSKLSMIELESRIAQTIGRKCGIYDLTKREAGQVIEDLAGTKASSGRR